MVTNFGIAGETIFFPRHEPLGGSIFIWACVNLKLPSWKSSTKLGSQEFSVLSLGMACLSEVNLQEKSMKSWKMNLQWWHTLNFPISCCISEMLARQAPFFIIWIKSLSFNLEVILNRFCMSSLKPTYYIIFSLRCGRQRSRDSWLLFDRSWLKRFLLESLFSSITFRLSLLNRYSLLFSIRFGTLFLHCVSKLILSWQLTLLSVFLTGILSKTKGRLNLCRNLSFFRWRRLCCESMICFRSISFIFRVFTINL